MRITFLGHSSFLVEGSLTLLFDPFLKDNPVATIAPESLKPDYIFVSHGHNDHFGDALEISRRSGAPIVSVNELSLYCQRQGVASHAMHIGGFHRFNDSLGVKLTAALHGSANDGVDHAYLGLACGFLVELDGMTLYFAGDTALTYDMKAVIGDLHAIDIAFLPIGDNFTMGPDDAVVAAQWLGAKTIIPMHYNTYPLLAQDAEAYGRAVTEKCGAKTCILQPNETREF